MDSLFDLTHHHHHPLVQQFDPITFVFSYLQQNAFFIQLTMAMSVMSVLFDAWILGLFVFEYDKDNLILDQKTREDLPPNNNFKPNNNNDVFPNRDFE